MIASVVREELHDIDEMMEILDDASQVIEYSRKLEEKSHQLELTTEELTRANSRLKELKLVRFFLKLTAIRPVRAIGSRPHQPCSFLDHDV